MNASYFVLVAALLAFATGFFVAAIIWGIKLALAPKAVRESSKSVHLLHIFSKHDTSKSFSFQPEERKTSQLNIDSVINQELYQYYHGKN